jgi:hypothetical protein
MTPGQKARQEMVAEYVKQMGGTSVVADLANVVPGAVSNWINRGRFPAYTYIRLASQLKSPPPAFLFGMEARRRRRS